MEEPRSRVDRSDKLRDLIATDEIWTWRMMAAMKRRRIYLGAPGETGRRMPTRGHDVAQSMELPATQALNLFGA